MVQITFTLAIFGVFLLSIATLGKTVSVSKACFGVQGIPCTRHNLECSSGRIAIQEAFYTVDPVCSSPIATCFDVDLSRIKINGTRYNFRDTELDWLYGNCSTLSTCTYIAGREGPFGLSVIVYQCIDDTIDMCNVTNVKRTDTSIIGRGSSDQNTCECTISKSTSTEQNSLTLTTLEIRDHCPSFTVSVDGMGLPIPCSQFTAENVLHNSTNWIDVTLSFNVSTSTNNSVIWLEVQGTELLNIVCNELQTTLAGTTETIASEPATESSLSTARTGTTDVSSQEQTTGTNYGFGGIFAAGLFTGLGIAVVIVGVVYFVYIRRRCVVKRPDPGPASLPHPTYSGLTDLGRPDTYDVINQPEGGARTSEPSQTPVYQNVADAS